MIPWEKVLTRAESVRLAVSTDPLATVKGMGIAARRDVATRLGVPVEQAPDVAAFVAEITPLNLKYTCSAIQRYTSNPCTWPAFRLAFVGCVHEHIAPTFLCAHHSASGINGEPTCHACGSDDHLCPLSEIPPGLLPDPEGLLVESLASQFDADERVIMREFLHANLDRVLPAHLWLAS